MSTFAILAPASSHGAALVPSSFARSPSSGCSASPRARRLARDVQLESLEGGEREFGVVRKCVEVVTSRRREEEKKTKKKTKQGQVRIESQLHKQTRKLFFLFC